MIKRRIAVQPCGAKDRAFQLLVAGLCVLWSGCAPRTELPQELSDFYVTMQHSALRFPQNDGAWDQHYGDAPYYGTAFYANTPSLRGDDGASLLPEHRTLARAAADHNLRTLSRAQSDRAYFIENLEEVMMSALGLIEYSAATSDRRGLAQLDATLDVMNGFAVALGYYIDIDAGMFAIKTYGPTAISAGVALLNLQYATYIGGETAPDRIDMARNILSAIDRKAWDGTRYRISPRDDLLELYPNTMMMLVLCRFYERTHEVDSLRRAEQVYAAIQPLRSPRGGYHSPYSAAAMGAKTEDYSTLSSQNYLTLALTLLFQNTGQVRYFDEALFVLDFVRTHLFDAKSGHLLHHFIDGRIALPSDPEYFCTGCNLQFLYAVHLLMQAIHPTPGPDA